MIDVAEIWHTMHTNCINHLPAFCKLNKDLRRHPSVSFYPL